VVTEGALVSLGGGAAMGERLEDVVEVVPAGRPASESAMGIAHPVVVAVSEEGRVAAIFERKAAQGSFGGVDARAGTSEERTITVNIF